MRLLGIFISFWLVSCASTKELKEHCKSGLAIGDSCKPFRVGMISLNPDLDRDKPIAALAYSGFTIHKGVLVGASSPKFLTGYSLDRDYFVWSLGLGSEVAGPLAVSGRFAYVCTRKGDLFKVDMVSGKRVWKTSLGRFTDREMAIAQGKVFLQTSTNQVFAIDAKTGAKKWVYDAGIAGNIVIRNGARPVVKGSHVYIGSFKGDIHVVNKDTGKLAKKITKKKSGARFSDVMGEMVVQSGQVLYSTYDGVVAKVRVFSGGQTVWKKVLKNAATSTYHSGTYYVGSLNGDIHALKSSDGKTRFKASLSQPVLSLTVKNDTLFAIGSKGLILAINTKNGKTQWVDHLHSDLDPRPTFYKDYAYFPTGLASLYTYKIK